MLLVWFIGFIIYSLAMIGVGPLSQNVKGTEAWVAEVLASMAIGLFWFIHLPVMILKKLAQ